MAEPVASVYPTSLDSATTLFGDSVNLKQFTLDAGINGAVTTISVAESIAAVNFPCYILIDSEIIYVETSAAGDFASCGRGAGGTSAVPHTNGTAVYLSYAGNMFSQLKRAIIATQTELGVAPKTIDDTVAPGASPASVAVYLDMVAYILKSLKGTAANWYTALTGSPGATTFLRGDGSWATPISNVNPNVLSNGGFRVAQRGAGPFTSASTFVNNDDTYLLDGCIFLADGADTCDVSQVADTDFVSGYKIRLDVETANRRFGILLPVENKDIQEIRKSGIASLQFKVKCTGTSMSNVRAYLLSWNSTADAITSDVISAWGAAGANPTLVANWTAENTASNLAINTTIATKTIENIAVDTSGVTNLAVLIIVDDTDATVGDFLEIGDIKLENGASCTTYQNPSMADSLQRCQRQLLVFQNDGTTWGVFGMGQWWTTTEAFVSVHFPVEMRIVPAFSYDALANFRIWAPTGAATLTPTVLANTYGTKKASTLDVTVAAGGTVGQAAMFSCNSTTNAFLIYSAEL